MRAGSVPIDATVAIVTPENIAFEYRVAGPFRRLPAFVLDLLLRLGVFLILVWIAPFVMVITGLAYLAFLLVIWFLMDWFYGSLFETYMNGQTPGKRVMGIRVLSVDGQPINGIQAVMRNVLRFADLMPPLSLQVLGPWWQYYFDEPPPPVYLFPTALLGLVVMTLNHRFQRLGDVVCGTMVVLDERKWFAGVTPMDDPRARALADYLPLDFRVSRSLAQALAAYMERRRYFPVPRQQEIARHLAEPLMKRWNLRPDTSCDLLLCALYYRTFIADRSEPLEGESPFAGGFSLLAPPIVTAPLSALASPVAPAPAAPAPPPPAQEHPL